jgi:hypothetical protein
MIATILRFKLENTFSFSDFLIDSVKQCYVLEDKTREDGSKVWGETAIPFGAYKIVFRTIGGLYNEYKTRFAHLNNKRGMLNIIGIPGFGGDVMIHCGNTPLDTLGCPLVGMNIDLNKGEIIPGTSSPAYELIYPIIAGAIEKAGFVELHIVKAV